MNHKNHNLSYNVVGVVLCYDATVNEDGNIEFDISSSDHQGTVTEIFLYCEDCDERVTGEEVGASEDWEAEPVEGGAS